MPQEIIPGVIAHKLKKYYPSVERLPITELPMTIRNNDPNLKFSPELKLKNDNFQIQVGPKSVSIVCPKEYQGWSKYYQAIKETFGEVLSLNVAKKLIQTGLRYISFFGGKDIFKNTNIKLELSNNSLIGQHNILRSEFNYDDFKCVVQIANNVSLGHNMQLGSNVDIDIIKVRNENDLSFSDFENSVENAHKVQKMIFFSLLKDDFLKTLKPNYGR